MPDFLANSRFQTSILIATILIYSTSVALAGQNGNSAFGNAENVLVGWTQGSLGQLLAITFFVVGLGFGIARQSLLAAATGVGAAFVVYYGPEVITNIVTVTVGTHQLIS